PGLFTGFVVSALEADLERLALHECCSWLSRRDGERSIWGLAIFFVTSDWARAVGVAGIFQRQIS
ncbi:MAG TPA: hypothetical protein V6D22_06210, partial [Candidatus Obscuribacterales bacterium]